MTLNELIDEMETMVIGARINGVYSTIIVDRLKNQDDYFRRLSIVRRCLRALAAEAYTSGHNDCLKIFRNVALKTQCDFASYDMSMMLDVVEYLKGD